MPAAPTDAELAAIAAAYAILTHATAAPTPAKPPVSRWRIAGRPGQTADWDDLRNARNAGRA